MSNNVSSSSASGGIGFFGGLTLLFIALKLTGFIAWSWFWVLSPIIFAFGIFLLAVGLFIWLALKEAGVKRR